AERIGHDRKEQKMTWPPSANNSTHPSSGATYNTQHALPLPCQPTWREQWLWERVCAASRLQLLVKRRGKPRREAPRRLVPRPRFVAFAFASVDGRWHHADQTHMRQQDFLGVISYVQSHRRDHVCCDFRLRERSRAVPQDPDQRGA